jgi:hypothetical protein
VFPASMLLLPVAYTVAPRFEYLPGLEVPNLLIAWVFESPSI